MWNLADSIDEFLIEQSVRGNSKKTLIDYRTKLRIFLEFSGNVDVKDIDLSMLRKYYLKLAETRSNTVTIQTYVRSLRAFLNWLYNNEYIENDLCKKFKLPKARKNCIDILTDEEIGRVYEACAGADLKSLRNRVIISLMLDSGLRLGEIVTAERAKLHLEERCLIVTGKGNKQRAVAFGNATQKHLREYLEKCPEVTPLIIKVSGNGAFSAITSCTVKELFRDLKIAAKIPRLHPHLLRHTFATRYLENGGNIYSLQLLLGHSSLEIVKNYLHLCTRRVRNEFVNYSPLDRVSLDASSDNEENKKDRGI